MTDYPRSEEEWEMLEHDLMRLYTLLYKAVAEGRQDRVYRLNWQIRELQQVVGERDD